VTFARPFFLKGVDRELPAGGYRVVTDEELIEGLSFPVYRGVSTMIFVPGQSASSFETTQNPSGQSPCVIAAHRTFCLRYGKWTLKLCQLFTDAKPEASECCRKAANTEVPAHLSNNAGAIGRHNNLQIESLRLGCRQRPAGVAARGVRRASLSSKG